MTTTGASAECSSFIAGRPFLQAIEWAKSTWAFSGADESELCFEAGALIRVLEKPHSDWWRGEIHGKEGLFPSAYVKIEETVQGSGRSVATSPTAASLPDVSSPTASPIAASPAAIQPAVLEDFTAIGTILVPRQHEEESVGEIF